MIKLKPSYQTQDGQCFATYEEAQNAELTALFEPPDLDAKWDVDKLVGFVLTHADALREILKPPMGRPAGSRNGAGKRKKSRIEVATEERIVQDMKQ